MSALPTSTKRTELLVTGISCLLLFGTLLVAAFGFTALLCGFFMAFGTLVIAIALEV